MRKTVFLNLITVVVSVLFSMMILEVGLRIYFRDDYSVPNHRNLLFKNVWSQKYINLNSAGFRGPEFTTAKLPGRFRILALGDSLTYGEGIKNAEDTYPRILERKLNQGVSIRRFEVINLSRCGNNVMHYIESLKDPGLSLKPDLVMIGFYINDIEDGVGFVNYDIEDRKTNFPRFQLMPDAVHFYFQRVSFLYHYASVGMVKMIIGDKYTQYQLSYVNADSKEWARFKVHWKRLLTICTREGIKVFVVILPHNDEFNDAHPFLKVYENVTELSRANHAPVLNLFPFFIGKNPKDLRVGVTDGHPNEIAHRIYADAVYQYLLTHADLLKSNRSYGQ